tara:strand:- start:1105 stop:1419 length:315 start_codon:yes stop_codon:yes gene_type:complete
MTNLIHVDVDASELEAKVQNELELQIELLEDRMGQQIDALTAKVEELSTTVETLEDHLREEAQQASLEGENPEGTDMLAKFLTQDEIDEFVKEILREATISIDV